MELVAGLGIAPAELRFERLDALELAGGESSLLAGSPPGAPRVALAVGSAAPSRRWPPERFAALADTLAHRLGAWVCLVGGPSDRPLAGRVLECSSTKPVDLVGRLALERMPALFSALDLVVSNDSGAAHLAGLAGVPCVVTFGAGNQSITAPLSPLVRIVSRPVFCSPCEKNSCRYNLECLLGIHVEDMYLAAVEALGRKRAVAR
jgi:ADP-heptose:LPS heptosyltransferase